ncbi:hypothetical protein C2845_PM16G02830 [Panicum miliaceum]|uniref:Uncharacterized protein n=1 Tax=Panicum miliaceum TaxID=4540 RepID=A0A3L6PWT6_PANMI|nr:hypothetical protein C2845_PM16G02830 [Panicum miliaceum]
MNFTNLLFLNSKFKHRFTVMPLKTCVQTLLKISIVAIGSLGGAGTVAGQIPARGLVGSEGKRVGEIQRGESYLGVALVGVGGGRRWLVSAEQRGGGGAEGKLFRGLAWTEELRSGLSMEQQGSGGGAGGAGGAPAVEMVGEEAGELQWREGKLAG